MNHLSRREILPLLALPALASLGSSEPMKKSPVVDCHLHCFAGRKDPKFPYHPKGPYQPEPVASPELLLKCMEGAGVDFAVVVHPEPYQDDNRYLLHCLEVGKKKLRGTCLLFAGTEKVGERMKQLAANPLIRAVRIHAYAPERLPPFGKPEFRDFWKAAVDAGLMVQLHLEPRFAEGFTPLIREFKDVKVIIDHLGRPMQGTPKEHDLVLKWSELPNTVMKISSVPETKQYPHREIGPIIRQLTDAWGADRLIYGGGFGDTATGESYRKERERIFGFLAHLKPEERAKIEGINAVKLFGFS